MKLFNSLNKCFIVIVYIKTIFKKPYFNGKYIFIYYEGIKIIFKDAIKLVVNEINNITPKFNILFIKYIFIFRLYSLYLLKNNYYSFINLFIY